MYKQFTLNIGKPIRATMSIEAGHFGINLHRASEGEAPRRVDRWSAGCQVIPNYNDFALVMALCRKQADQGNPEFTYTLLTEEQL